MEKVSSSSSSSSSKRLRSDPEESNEAKRIRADLFDILANDGDETDSAVEDLACVMQSLQEEISISLPATMPTEETIELPDLDYLLEASDDELGLPPTVPSPAGDVGSDTESVGEVEVAECGQMWGFIEDALDFGIRPQAPDGAVMCQYGPFDDFSGAADFFEVPWQLEWLPAL